MKVYELAKILNIRPTKACEILNKEGIYVRNHMTKLGHDDLDKAKSILRLKKRKTKKILNTTSKNALKDKLSNQNLKTLQALKLDLKEKEESIEKDKIINDLKSLTLEELLKNRSIDTLESNLIKYKIDIPRKIQLVSEFEKIKHKINDNDIYQSESNIHASSLNDERIKQLEFQIQRNNAKDDQWAESIQQGAVCSEVAFENDLKMYNIDHEPLSENDHYNAYDFIVNGKGLDVKARCLVGRSAAKIINLKEMNTDCKNGEIIAFYKASKSQLNSLTIKCNEVGIHDPNLFKDVLDNDYATFSFFNPLHFIPFQIYFDTLIEKTYQEFDLEVYNYLIKRDGASFDNAIVNFFGKKIVLDLFMKRESFPKYLIDIAKIILEDDSKIAPFLVYKWALKKIYKSEEFNYEHLEAYIFPFIKITKMQKDYLKALSKLSNYLPYFKCKFTGLDIKNCKITESRGVIYAKALGEDKGNTLFAYSWANGETLVIGDRKSKVCDLDDCACLTHRVGEHRFGRQNCKKYGKRKLK